MLTCIFSAITLGPYAISINNNPDPADHTNRALCLMAVIFDVTFAIALLLFAIGHFYLAMKNQTSIEDSKSSKKYDRGWYENMQSVFGKDPRFWLIPVYRTGPEGDGVHWLLSSGIWDGHAEKEPEFDDGS